MDRRFLMVLAVSLVFALVVSAVFYQMTAKAGRTRKPEARESRDLVVAVRPLSPGWLIKSTDLRLVKVPPAAVPKGSYAKIEEVVDRSLISNVLADEAILDGRLAPKGSGVGLSPVIPVGMRAVTVRVNDVVGVAGFVLPGMRVDILITGEPPGGASRMTKTVLQNILVLSAGATMQTDTTGKPVNAPNVTLLVTLSQAEALTLSGHEGKIQLVLRNAGDQDIQTTPGSSLAQLYGVKDEARPARRNLDDLSGTQPRVTRRAAVPALPPEAKTVAAAPPPDTVILIRGIEKKSEVLPVEEEAKP